MTAVSHIKQALETVHSNLVLNSVMDTLCQRIYHCLLQQLAGKGSTPEGAPQINLKKYASSSFSDAQ